MMLKKIPGKHWLAGQWGLWCFDALAGRLPSLGFARWATCRDNCVLACQGEAWGSHWQWGDLRLAPWGCWLQDDCHAWAYVADEDRFFCSESWSLSASAMVNEKEVSADHALSCFAVAALASEFRRPAFQNRWEFLEQLRQADLVTPQAGRQWQIQVGSHFLQDSQWHRRGFARG